MEIRNYFVNFDDGSNGLIHCNQSSIGAKTIKRYCERVTGKNVLEVYHIPQEDLQYYSIDERIWVDTAEKAGKMRQIAFPRRSKYDYNRNF